MLGKYDKNIESIKKTGLSLIDLVFAFLESSYIRYKRLNLSKKTTIKSVIIILLIVGIVYKCAAQDELQGRQFDPSIDPCGMWYQNDCENQTTRCEFKFSQELFDVNNKEMLASCLNLFSVCAQHSVPVMCNEQNEEPIQEEPIQEEKTKPFDLFNEENELIY